MNELDRLIPVVVVGSVDHGKSTFIGRLLHDTGQLTPDRLKDIEDTGHQLNQKVEYAHVTDQFQEEREANITIDTTETRFVWKDRLYMLIDAPGHKEYLANMITGAARAEHAVLMLDVHEGIQAQTEKHAEILKLLGIRHLAVLLNKMDLIGYKKETYDQFFALISESLKSRGLSAGAIIPLAAYHGENVSTRSVNMSWYKGPTALEFLESCGTEDTAKSNQVGRFPVQYIHTVDKTQIVLGRVEEGLLKAGQTLHVFPDGGKVKILRIRRQDHPDLTEAGSGQCVGLELDKPGLIKRGTLLTTEKIDDSKKNEIVADVFWGTDKVLRPGDEIRVECRTQSASAKVASIQDEESNQNLSQLEQGGLGRVQITLQEPLFLKPLKESDVFGRIVFNRQGETVGCGVVAHVG